ncbi:MAG: glucosaminidase domain-containing protein [Candidatus Yonathbacteria bacterium]|nr:glucosaminidase domain-containing protein [Candidatus Yonathbacteria bacterium]
MKKQKIQFMRGLALIPFLTASSPFALLQNQIPPIHQVERFIDGSSIRDDHASKIDAYFAERNMPLEGYGSKMIAEAEKNDIDWRLLPAIAIKESSGGRFACGYNPFGWGSCKIKFSDYDTAIETIALNLGGNNPHTTQYYKDKTLIEKLHYYNNSVVPTYTAEVLEFMDLIEREG